MKHPRASDAGPGDSRTGPHIRLLDDDELGIILPLVQALNPKVAPATLAARLEDMRGNGYGCVAAFAGDRCLGIAGLWFGTRFWCGRYVDIDNVIVAEPWRGQGIGQALIGWIEDYARQKGCEKVVLDAYTTNERAHAFYARLGYRVVGLHFDKDLKPAGNRGKAADTQPARAGRARP